jgi:anti-sigma regulatory factor (Ser/Thr protein kinase)
MHRVGVSNDVFFNNSIEQIVTLAARHAIPVMYPSREYVVAGGLISYGARSIKGCDIVINTPAAQQFAMIVHELATNALKYGALSAPGGRIIIEGSTEGDTFFKFVWSEHGGPPVVVPSRKGFGTAILIDTAKQLAQNVSVNYDPNGLRYELQVAVRDIKAAPSPTASGTAASA